VGYLYALAAALLFGANGSVTKVVIEAGISPTQLTQFRVLGTALIAGAILLVIDRSAFRIGWRQVGVMAFLGIAGVAVLQASYAVAIQLLPVGIALLLEYLAVLFVAVIAFVFLKERVNARLWVAIGCVLVGLAVVAQIWNSDLNPLGVVMALVAAVSLTLYFIVGERQVGATSPLAVSFWTTGFASLFWAFFSGWWDVRPDLLAAPVSLTGNLDALVTPLWAPLAWCVVLGSFAPFLLSFLALKHLSATAAGVVASSEVIFAFVVAWVWLGEALNPVQVGGAAVVLVGIILAQTARAGKVVDADLALVPDELASGDEGPAITLDEPVARH
jgi:drug/metabolite transporter (DMT)-like permease